MPLLCVIGSITVSNTGRNSVNCQLHKYNFFSISQSARHWTVTYIVVMVASIRVGVCKSDSGHRNHVRVSISLWKSSVYGSKSVVFSLQRQSTVESESRSRERLAPNPAVPRALLIAPRRNHVSTHHPAHSTPHLASVQVRSSSFVRSRSFSSSTLR